MRTEHGLQGQLYNVVAQTRTEQYIQWQILVGAPYRVLLYQPGIRFILITNSKVLSLQQPIPLASPKSLSSQIQFMLQKRSLIHCYIPSKFIWLLSLENFISFSLRIKIIQSNSGSVLADVINLSTKSSTKRPSRSIPSPYSLANCLGIIVRRSNAMTLPIDGK